MQPDSAWTYGHGGTTDTVTGHDAPTVVMKPVAPRRRWRRFALRTLIAVGLVIVLLIASGVFFWYNPAALGTISTPFLPPHAGAVPWNGSDPINILAMGVDERPGETAHSDTMIVITLDPGTRHVRMVSIPRDLAVNVPGFGNVSKINAAYAMGAGSDAPQGGARYAALTVEQSLGIPISYYAVLNFGGFKRLIDALGGVDMVVDRDISDPIYPADEGYGIAPFVISKGSHHMDGATALRYVRERHAYVGEEDQARIRHQQELISAIKGRLFSLHTLLNMPGVLSALRGALNTNLPENLLPVVGLMMAQERSIEHDYLDEKAGLAHQCIGYDHGADLCPSQPQFDQRLAALFGDQQRRIAGDGLTVVVENGTPEPNEARQVVKLLRACRFTVRGTIAADSTHHAHSAVIVNTAQPGAAYSIRVLRQMFGARLIERSLPSVQAQVVLLLGRDMPLIPPLSFQ